MTKLLGVVFMVAFIIFALLIGPWCVIWAINELMTNALAGSTSIPQITFTFWTWLAAAILGGFALIPRFSRS